MSRAALKPPLLLSVFSTFKVGGPQVRFAAIANHFGDHFRHVIVAMDDAYDCKDRLSSKLDITLLPLEIRKRETLSNRRRFRSLLQSIRPSHLVTYNWGTIEWAMANWPRLVPHLHIEDGFGPEEAIGQLLRRNLTRRVVLRRSTIVVPSRKLERIATDTWKLKRANVHYIPNGIDCRRFADAPRKPSIPPSGPPVIGTVAALRPEKNLHRLLETFRLVRNEMPCRLVIAGDGSEREQLESHAKELGVTRDVLFTGYRHDTESIYADLDVFVLSSNTEQMPTSVIEAMAAGLPIVATDVGDIATMVSKENRQFVVPPSAEALARASLLLLRDESLRRKLGSANQSRAMRDYSQENMFAAYGRLLDAPS